MTRQRLRNAFVALGAARPSDGEAGDLSQDKLGELVVIVADKHGVVLDDAPQPSLRLQRCAANFCKLVQRELRLWTKANRAAFLLGEDADTMYNRDGADVALSVLRASTASEALAILEAQWSECLRPQHADAALKRLYRHLTQGALRTYCRLERGGHAAGQLEEALRSDAQVAFKEQELLVTPAAPQALVFDPSVTLPQMPASVHREDDFAAFDDDEEEDEDSECDDEEESEDEDEDEDSNEDEEEDDEPPRGTVTTRPRAYVNPALRGRRGG